MTYYRIPNGTRVECYWNIHRRCFSVRVNGRVVSHTRAITVDDARLVVQPAGRERARREGRKNVHAFVRGTWNDTAEAVTGYLYTVTYNPMRDDTFVRKSTGTPVTECARLVGLTGPGMTPTMFAYTH
jgi:hypothetical protein